MTAHDDLIERLRKEADRNWFSPSKEAADLIEQQARDIEALKADCEAQIQLARDAVEVAAMFQKDAARYEALRHPGAPMDGVAYLCVRFTVPGVVWQPMVVVGPELDRMVDAVIARKEST